MVGLVCYPYFCVEKGGCTCTTGDRYFHKHSDNWYVLTVDIFCYESGKWSQRRVFTRRILNSLSWSDSLVAYRGILHWVNCDQTIFACDPLKKPWRLNVIDTPADGKEISIGVCRGKLQMSQLQLDTLNPFADNSAKAVSLSVWELEDYDAGKWRLEHMVYLKDMVSVNSEDYLRMIKEARKPLDPVKMVKLLAFHRHDVDIVYLIFLKWLVVSCNLQARTLQVVSKVQLSKNEDCCSLPCGNFCSTVHSWWPTPVSPLSFKHEK